LWVELLVLEALVGQTLEKPSKALMETNLMMVLEMSDHELKSMFDGLRWMASRSPI